MQPLIDFAVANPVLAGSVLTCLSGIVGIVIGKYLDRSFDRSERREAERSAAANCTLVSLYAKVVRWELGGEGAEPLFLADVTRMPSLPAEVGVFDETVYTSVAVYDKETTGHEYIFRGSGVVDLLCLSPWRDQLRFPDRGAAEDQHQIRQAFSDQPSSTYVIVAHAYNGLQLGNEDFGVRVPIDCSVGRLVVDLSSVPHVIQAMTQPPRAELRLATGAESPRPQVFEYRRGIYTIEASDLRKDDVLFLDFTIGDITRDGDAPCRRRETTS